MNELKAWCRRYISLTLLASIAVGVWVFFLNENSLQRTAEQEQRIEQLESAIAEATDTLEYYRGQNHLLDTDKETLEQIVREHYHMQHPDEDVYIYE